MNIGVNVTGVTGHLNDLFSTVSNTSRSLKWNASSGSRKVERLVSSWSWEYETRSSAVAKRPCDCCMGHFCPKYNWKRIFCTQSYRSVFNHCEKYCLLIYQIRWNNANQGPLRHSRSFKVTDLGTNQKPVCDFHSLILFRTFSKLSQLLLKFCSKNGQFAFWGG